MAGPPHAKPQQVPPGRFWGSKKAVQKREEGLECGGGSLRSQPPSHPTRGVGGASLPRIPGAFVPAPRRALLGEAMLKMRVCLGAPPPGRTAPY